MEHYLDNSATTAVSRAAAEKAFSIMTECYGNPSSLHLKGLEAERELNAARKSVAARLKVGAEEIFFTSGGTEANNTALFGAAYAAARVRRKIVISSVEHSSVTEAAKRLEDEGFTVERVAPRSDGVVHPADVAAAVDGGTAIVSDDIPMHGHEQSIELTLPPLSVMYFKCVRKKPKRKPRKKAELTDGAEEKKPARKRASKKAEAAEGEAAAEAKPKRTRKKAAEKPETEA